MTTLGLLLMTPLVLFALTWVIFEADLRFGGRGDADGGFSFTLAATIITALWGLYLIFFV